MPHLETNQERVTRGRKQTCLFEVQEFFKLFFVIVCLFFVLFCFVLFCFVCLFVCVCVCVFGFFLREERFIEHLNSQNNIHVKFSNRDVLIIASFLRLRY